MATDVVRVAGHSLGGRLFLSLWGGLTVVDLVRPTLGAGAAGVLVVVLVAACGVGQPPASALAIGATGWLVIDGFVQHRYGELGLGATSLVLLGATVSIVMVVSRRTPPADTLPSARPR